MMTFDTEKSLEVFLTSENGDCLTAAPPIQFSNRTELSAIRVRVDPGQGKQRIDGIGTSFTESSAFVLAHLDPELRREVMANIFGAAGANFTLTRTHIGACDFSVEGRYSCASVREDLDLKYFSIEPHLSGFPKEKYPGIRDEEFSLVQMIREAMAIKRNQADETLRIIASAWSAPPWMKNIDDWYVPASEENGWKGTGGVLRPVCNPVYADYLVKFLDAYKKEGIDIWGLTPVNEPCGNNGQWESMHFTPASQNDFVKNYLGPKLQASVHKDVRLLVYDQNRDEMEEWADVMFSDPETAKLTYGLAVHWYSSSFKVYDDIFRRIKQKYPEQTIIHTEGCIDDLGKDAPKGVLDPDRFKESGWFANDAFWWNENATDWAYSATWEGVNAEDHPIYTPVHRYARDIIGCINNWVSGWVDWNIVLDSTGGPNHVGNFCGAPIMIDTASGKIHYTPIFSILSQFSRTIRPGDVAVQTETVCGQDDALHACATLNSDKILTVQVLNTTRKPMQYSLQIEKKIAQVEITANALQTIRIQL